MEIKKFPDDFKVSEMSNIPIKDEGVYTYFIMDKKNYNTVKALETIANALHVPFKNMGFAGNKDKKAITSQICSVKSVSKERLEKIELKDIKLTYLGKGDKPVSLGNLLGNSFEILVRNVKEPKPIRRFLNLFGKQRFGGNNIEIGRAIVKKDFNKVCELLKIKDINELRSMNKKISRIYVHAYQSFIWNKTVKELLRNNKEMDKVPVIGFGTESDLVKDILKKEGINQRDFIIRQIPDLSSEGTERKMYCNVKNLEIIKKDKNILLKFFLPKGSYATVFIDQLFKVV